ncbi:hypothetical protein [Pseudoduganella umbonata]|uniref:Uncharacterized protein n=1 Tax=Pseudoduganella umbonata TaxID=864828 RepID=A0A4V1EE76_9BURK|nr:hypothetical protein [Pseudoduganella umbonata]MBB3223508.1 hypothetical protein [Pseudoduganella umbonata]QCP13611.1 hypothetical protein FCL38_26610 [Pseudoduganella umbonata]
MIKRILCTGLLALCASAGAMAAATFAEPPTSAPGAQPVIKARTQNRITKAQPAEGRIGFQLEGAAYQLRNVRLEKL